MLVQIKELDQVNAASKVTVKLLEDKIAKVEEAALRSFQEKSHEISALKMSLKSQEDDFNSLKKIKVYSKAYPEK